MKLTKRLAATAACAVMATSSMIGTAAFAVDDYTNTLVPTTIVCSSGEEVYSTNASISVVPHKLKNNFPIYKQKEGSYYCWAECARAIINYNLGTSYTYDNIVSTAKNLSLNQPAYIIDSNGAANAELTFAVIGNYLGTYGYVSSISGTPISLSVPPISISELRSRIDNDVPVLMCLKNDTNTAGHMVVATGYSTAYDNYPSYGLYKGDITGIYYMDPVTGTEEHHKYFESDGNFTVTVNNYQTQWKNETFRWRRAIYSYKFFY